MNTVQKSVAKPCKADLQRKHARLRFLENIFRLKTCAFELIDAFANLPEEDQAILAGFPLASLDDIRGELMDSLRAVCRGPWAGQLGSEDLRRPL